MMPKIVDAGPLVSVIVPTYDRPDMLREAIESVVNQTYPHLELVVVDDASPRPAEPVVDANAPADLEWTCLRHDRNRGANAARTSGIEAAEGEIVAFLDDDDQWLPEKLAAQMSAFQEGGPAMGVVLVGQRYVDEDGRTSEMKRPRVARNATVDLLSGEAAGPFSVMAVRRETIAAAGPPDEHFPSLQDREWLIRLSRHCTFGCVSDPLVLRRMGSYGQIADRYVERRDVTYPRFLEKHRDLAAAQGCERAFVAWLTLGVAASALQHGAYADAIRYGLRSIRAEPTRRGAWGCVFLALGGDLTYRPAIRLRRGFTNLVHG